MNFKKKVPPPPIHPYRRNTNTLNKGGWVGVELFFLSSQKGGNNNNIYNHLPYKINSKDASHHDIYVRHTSKTYNP